MRLSLSDLLLPLFRIARLVVSVLTARCARFSAGWPLAIACPFVRPPLGTLFRGFGGSKVSGASSDLFRLFVTGRSDEASSDDVLTLRRELRVLTLPVLAPSRENIVGGLAINRCEEQPEMREDAMIETIVVLGKMVPVWTVYS